MTGNHRDYARGRAGIVWSQERVDFMRECFLQLPKLSASKIAVACTERFHIPVSTNAVIGKSHRMSDLLGRPNPIKRIYGPPPPPTAESAPPIGATRTLDLLPCLASSNNVTVFRDRQPPRHSAVAVTPSTVVPFPERLATVERLRPCLEGPIRRRDGSGCLYPVGDPKQRGFHMCDADLYDRSKPYCASHAKETRAHEHRAVPAE